MKVKMALFLSVFILMAGHAFARPKDFAVSDSGLGPISGKTPFDADAIQKLLPAYEVNEAVRYTEGEPYPVVEVSLNDKLLATVNPSSDRTSIFSVQVISNSAGLHFKWPIGTKFLEVYGEGGDPDPACMALGEEMSGKVSCAAPDFENIRLVLGGKFDGPDGIVPPKAVLRHFRVEQIVWKPRHR